MSINYASKGVALCLLVISIALFLQGIILVDSPTNSGKGLLMVIMSIVTFVSLVVFSAAVVSSDQDDYLDAMKRNDNSDGDDDA